MQEGTAALTQGISTAQKLIDLAIEFIVTYSLDVLGALIVLIVGAVAGNWVCQLLLKQFERQKMDLTLAKFIANTGKFTVLAFAMIVALGKFGITIAPFVAALGAAAFGASYAIQGPLSNYGAGIAIIMSRPFVVGDTITVASVSGVVEEVKLGATILVNEDGIRITIPNKHIVGEIVHNSKANKVADGVVGISYDSDPARAIELVRGVLAGHSDVSTSTPAQIGIREFADSSINIAYRYWIPTRNYFKISYAVNAGIFKAFKENNIVIPFPQRDVHVVSQTSGSGTKLL